MEMKYKIKDIIEICEFKSLVILDELKPLMLKQKYNKKTER